MPHNKPSYIASIDGLRAVAVCIVVFFHAGFESFSGGFIGVDIFFVISGFLITTNILHAREQDNFSFSSFYQKRIARLFPALFTVILITLLAGFFILSPSDLAELGKTGIYSSVSVSNIFFWLDSGYFDRASEVKPFLHTWSLSVEEQFYLLWPGILIVLYKIGSRRGVFFGLVLLTIASLLTAIFYHKIDPEAVFYLAPFRVYQFGLGALLVFIPFLKFQMVRGILAYIAVAGIFIISYKLEGTNSLFLSSILPAIFSCIFILGSKNTICRSIFSSSLMIWMGQRSYSIYLVHWPLMTLWKLNTDYEFSMYEKYLAVILSIVLGSVLHFSVEKRFRFNTSFALLTKNRIIIATMSFLVINIVIASHYWGAEGYPERIHTPEELIKITKNMGALWKMRTSQIRNGDCNLHFNKYKVSDFNMDLCLKDDKTKDSWLILGDSHASGAYVIFKKSYPYINFNQLTIPGCRIRPTKRIKGEKMCDQLQRNILKYLKSDNHIKGVIIASNWMEGYLYEIEELINEIRASKKKVILINQRAIFKDTVPNIILSSNGKSQATAKAQRLLKSDKTKLVNAINKRFTHLVTVLDIFKLQCQSHCKIFDNEGQLIYLDSNHFSLAGIDLIAKRLQQKLPNLFDSER